MIYGSQRNELQPKEKAKAMHSKIMVALLYFFFFFLGLKIGLLSQSCKVISPLKQLKKTKPLKKILGFIGFLG